MIFPPNQKAQTGREAIREWHRDILENFSEEVKLKAIDIRVFEQEDIAYLSGEYVVTLKAPGVELAENGRMLITWVRDTDGRWKIAGNIWNSSDPPQGQ